MEFARTLRPTCYKQTATSSGYYIFRICNLTKLTSFPKHASKVKIIICRSSKYIKTIQHSSDRTNIYYVIHQSRFWFVTVHTVSYVNTIGKITWNLPFNVTYKNFVSSFFNWSKISLASKKLYIVVMLQIIHKQHTWIYIQEIIQFRAIFGIRTIYFSMVQKCMI